MLEMENVYQDRLEGSDVLENIEIYYRPVKSEDFSDVKKVPIDSSYESEEARELVKEIKREKLKYPIPLNESEMEEDHFEIVKKVMDLENLELTIKLLLSQFAGGLEGRARESGKYTMLVHMGDQMLIAHVDSGKVLSIDEDAEEDEKISLVQRFLDLDNIKSAALFERDNGDIKMSHFTDSGADSFREFLGVQKSGYNYEKKTIQIRTYFGNGVDCTFEFSHGELENKWLRDNHVEFNEDRIFFHNDEDLDYKIEEIRWGSETYSVDEFKSAFRSYINRLDRFQKQYKNIYEKLDGVDRVQNQSITDTRNETVMEDQVIKKESPKNEDVTTLFADSNIDISESFATNIFREILKGNEVKLYHASSTPHSEAFQLENLTILNKVDLSASKETCLREIFTHLQNVSGKNTKTCVLSAALYLLAEGVNNRFEAGINQIINVNEGQAKHRGVVTAKEGDGGGLIQFKDRDELDKESPEESIYSSLKTYDKEDNSKLIFFGVDEDERAFNGLRTSRFDDDRVEALESQVNDKLEDDEDIEREFEILPPMPLGPDKSRCVLLGMFMG